MSLIPFFSAAEEQRQRQRAQQQQQRYMQHMLRQQGQRQQVPSCQSHPLKQLRAGDAATVERRARRRPWSAVAVAEPTSDTGADTQCGGWLSNVEYDDDARRSWRRSSSGRHRRDAAVGDYEFSGADGRYATR